MTLESFDMFFYTLAFIVPGFIIDFIYRYCFPQKDDNSQSTIIRFLWFSSINYGLCSGLIYYLATSKFDKNHPIGAAVIWLAILFIIPIMIGFLISFVSRKAWFRKVLQKLGLNPVHVIPTAWDYKFNEIRDPSYVIVYLESGSTVAGLYAGKSFASSIPGERDVYLEKVFNIDEQLSWTEIPSSKGIWIAGNSIHQIEFF